LPSDLKPEETIRRLLGGQSLCARTEAFLDSPPESLTAGDGIVYVAKSECAIVYGGGAANGIGSDEATTSVIVVLRGEVECDMFAAICMHLDLKTDGQAEHLAQEAASLFRNGSPLDLYLLGCYRDTGPLDRWLSWPILSSVVANLHSAELVIRVQLAAVHAANTAMKKVNVFSIPAKCRRDLPGELAEVEVPCPLRYGLALDINTGKARPAEFFDRGAAPLLRGVVWPENSPAFEPYQPATDTYEFAASKDGLQTSPGLLQAVA